MATIPAPPVPWREIYEQMLTIRVFEEQVNQLYTTAKMPGLAHLYSGEEAVAVGVCAALRLDDYITSTHRGHGHCLAKGASIDRMFAELLGREAGYCRGKGGSMHIADQQSGNLGANAIVGGSAGIATGAALSAQMRGSGQVAVCFFGEGALGQGLLYEVMNMASLWHLPVVYVCENNLYSEYTHYTRDHRRQRDRAGGGLRAARPRPSTARMSAPSTPRRPRRSREPAQATAPASSSARPTACTATTSAMSTGRYYRSREEEATWRDDRDPIARHGAWLREQGLASEADLTDIDARVRAAGRGGRRVRARCPLPRSRRGRPACLRIAPRAPRPSTSPSAS